MITKTQIEKKSKERQNIEFVLEDVRIGDGERSFEADGGFEAGKRKNEHRASFRECFVCGMLH